MLCYCVAYIATLLCWPLDYQLTWVPGFGGTGFDLSKGGFPFLRPQPVLLATVPSLLLACSLCHWSLCKPPFLTAFRYEYERNNNFYTLPFNSSFSMRLVIFNLLNIVRTLVCGLGFVLVSIAPFFWCTKHLDAAAPQCAIAMAAKGGCSMACAS